MNLILSDNHKIQVKGNSKTVSAIIDNFDTYYNRPATNLEKSIGKRFLTFVADNNLYLSYSNNRKRVVNNQTDNFINSIGIKSIKQYKTAINKLNPILETQNIVSVINDNIDKDKVKTHVLLSDWFDTIDFKKTKQTYKNAFESFTKYVAGNGEGSQAITIRQSEEVIINIFTSSNVIKWKNKLLEEDKSIYTINCWLSALKSFCKFTASRDEIFNLPHDQREVVIRELNRIRDIKNIKTDATPEHEKGSFTKEELEVLINKPTDAKGRLLIALCGYLGLRIKEALLMEFKDITKTSYKVIGKGYKNKTTTPFMPSKLWELFQEVTPSEGLIFKGWSYPKANKLFNETLKDCNLSKHDQDGKPRSLHSLRHTFCQLVTDATSLEFASRLCRHKSLDVTKRYYQAKINRHDFSQYSNLF